MQIRIKETYYEVSEYITTVSGYVESSLDGEDYDRGVLAAMQRKADNSIEALARLCDVLAEKGIISLQDVVYVAKGYKDYDDKLEVIE